MDNTKKIEQKRRRFIARLNSSKGLVFTTTPQKFIILCNVGQATGMTKDVIFQLIQSNSPYNNTTKYIAKKGESHSFLIFDSVNKAKCFYEKCNGLLQSLNNLGNEILIYMAYVESAPSDEVLYRYRNPEGLHLLNDFISEDEERQLLVTFDYVSNIEGNSLKNRQVKHYGYEFKYGSNDVDLNTPLLEKIPEVCQFLWPRLINFGIYIASAPDQLTVNKYNPGQGIPSHVDKHSPFGDIILSLSLGSSILMDWKHYDGSYVPMLIPARSMLVMTEESRYDWQHGIQPRTWDPILEERSTPLEKFNVLTSDTVPRGMRLSLTFRWTRDGPCECRYKTLCDSVNINSTENINDHVAATLEDLHVHQVYEKISDHFSSTRHKPWPKVVDFMKKVPSGSIVLDLGSGNGKNILKRYDILQIAAERSSGLLGECKTYISDIPSADCVRLDLLNSTFMDNCADFIICIAVIHHFSSKTRRLQAISTISRLLRTGGKALITVWARDQNKSNYLSKNKTNEGIHDEVHVTVEGLNLPVHENRTQFQHNDLLVPWKLRQVNENKIMSNKTEKTLLRYYHVFEECELEDLCLSDSKLVVNNSFYEEGNWCVICTKI